MFAPFSQSLARHYCQDFISDLESGVLIFKQISQISEERISQGLMIGSLVCYDEKSNRIILHCVSGIAKNIIVSKTKKSIYYKNGIKHIIVNPIVSNKKITSALRKNDLQIHKLTNEINDLKNNLKRQQTKDVDKKSLQIEDEEIAKKTEIRKELCSYSLKKVFSLYKFNCFNGKKVSLNEIIKINRNALPPTGTGDCCAPKLLSYAYKHKLNPLSMDEVYYGKDTDSKKNGISYEPCDERCKIILPYIIGLEILYRDSQIIVINKPSGLLSVPGRGRLKKDSVETRVRILEQNCIEQPAVHRLDMETSGILVLAFTKEAHSELNMQFMNKKVQKKYVAYLDGILEHAKGKSAPKNGEIKGKMELKFRLDPNNRPHQIYDEKDGKLGITEWKKEGTILYENPVTHEKKRLTKITFIPHTGRTHQLRLAASSMEGFGIPILGDSLYGTCKKGERLMLFATEISFEHPVSKELMHFEVPPKF